MASEYERLIARETPRAILEIQNGSSSPVARMSKPGKFVAVDIGADVVRVVADEFDGPLDLVIDTASHPSRDALVSFNALFPLLRAGGLYVIEDWARPCLVDELVSAVACQRGAVESVHVNGGFVAVRRGPAELRPLG